MFTGKTMVNPDINWLSNFITEDPETFQEGLPGELEEIEGLPGSKGQGGYGLRDYRGDDDKLKLSNDVKRTSEKMEKTSGLKDMLGKINTRQELEQFLLEILKSVNVRPGDIYSAMVKAAKKAKEM